MVESYFKSILKPRRQNNIIDLVEKLPKPDIDESVDLKNEYYHQKKPNMVSTVMLDVNVILDFTMKREHYEKAKQIFEILIYTRIDGFITPSIVQISGYWLSKAFGVIKAKKILSTLLLDIKILDSNHQITINALNSHLNDIEDALQYYTVLHHKIDVFISRDNEFKKAAIPALPVYTPDEFLNEFK